MDVLNVEQEIKSLGQEILKKSREQTPSIFNKNWWNGKILEYCMQHEAFKQQLFAFIDVFPTLKTLEQIQTHIEEYFKRPSLRLPSSIQLGLLAAESSITANLAIAALKKNISNMAQIFIAGATPQDALKNLRKLWDNKIAFTTDLLGEKAVSEKEAGEHEKQYLELIDTLILETKTWPNQGSLEPIVNISVKISALNPLLDPLPFSYNITKTKERLRPIFRKIKDKNCTVYIDMEHYALKNLTLAIFKSLLEEEEFHNFDEGGIVLQAYLKDTENDLLDLVEWCQKQQKRIYVRLVKGAYWDYEKAKSQQEGWPSPVFLTKEATDANYEKLTLLLLENHEYTRPVFGSHNVRSIAHALVQASKEDLPQNAIEIQMLYGMAEPIKNVLTNMGYRVRDYVAIGELVPGMAYLVRRLLENTSNESFLKQSYVDLKSEETLLQPPHFKGEETVKICDNFKNEPFLDFSKEENRKKMFSALELVKKNLGKEYPSIVGGKEYKTGHKSNSVNPANPDQIIGTVYEADEKLAQKAIEEAKTAFQAWSQTPAEERAQILKKAAEIIRSRRMELEALEILECGKQWREADGDICEAIDFLEYYAQEMIRLGEPQKMGTEPGETNLYLYKGKGIGVVISPWNFPIAIPIGMVGAALVTGNTVLFKPSEESPVCGYHIYSILKEAGVPNGALHFLPGQGGSLGRFLVNHPQVNFIAFTGSKEVGLEIVQEAAKTKPGQNHIKRVIAEMGGKNAIIVDRDANLDEAVTGILTSAFGYQGQKCSACSRAIIVEDCYNKFIERLKEAAESIKIAPAEDPGSFVGPVISKEAQEKVLRYIEIGKKEATLLVERKVPREGYFAPLTIFSDVKPTSVIAQEEIFGPVLGVLKAKDFDEAIQIANGTSFALTGAVYSRSPKNIEKAKKEFQVGNLYINRKSTGALVARQPFGGFKLSGIGSKAGGPDYLLQFMEPRTITEKH